MCVKEQDDEHFGEVDVGGAAAVGQPERVEVLPQGKADGQDDEAKDTAEHREHGGRFERRVPGLVVVERELLHEVHAQHGRPACRRESADRRAAGRQFSPIRALIRHRELRPQPARTNDHAFRCNHGGSAGRVGIGPSRGNENENAEPDRPRADNPGCCRGATRLNP